MCAPKVLCCCALDPVVAAGTEQHMDVGLWPVRRAWLVHHHEAGFVRQLGVHKVVR